MPVSTKLSASVPIADLESAGKVINEHIKADASRVPELDVALVATGGTNTTSASYSDAPSDAWSPFVCRKTLQLPPALLDELNVVPQSCGMGLLPEIHCAYISMNNQLYLWDYAAGSEFLRYEEQPHNITSVALVRPKSGIFIDSIEWILVIATKATVLLLGLSKDATTGEIKLYQTDMSVQVESDMDNVVGTQDGRVFMTGTEDGNMYELLYQVEEGWFSKRIRLNNLTIGSLQNILPSLFGYKQTDKIVNLAVDDERGFLYSYTQANASLTQWGLGRHGTNQLTHLGTIHSLSQDILPLLPDNPTARKFVNKDNFGVVGMHVVPVIESRAICLVAVTFSGLRIYITSTRSSYGASGFRVVHIRFPPPRTEAAALGDIAQSSYTNGSYLCAYSAEAVQDSTPVAGAVVDLGKLIKAQSTPTAQAPGMMGGGGIYNPYPVPRPPLSEYSDIFNCPGTPWAMKVMPKAPSISSPGGTGSIWVTGSTNPTALNSLATQFTEPPDQFLILSNVALTFVVRKRTTDTLKTILESELGAAMAGVPSQGGLSIFTENFGREETCAQLLALAAGNCFLSNEAYEPAAYSRAPGSAAAMLPGGLKDNRLSNLASQAFFERGGKPTWIDRGPLGTTSSPESQGQVIFSGRREGLALYMTRLLRPIWNEKITASNEAGRQDAAFSDHSLSNVQRNLNLLQEFLNANQHSFNYSVGELALNRPSTAQEAWKGEAISMGQLQDLLSQTIEAINFILFLIDYKISDVIASCDKATQDAVARLTYCDLVTTKPGRDIARALLNAVINQQLMYHIGLDAISETLQQRCGSFCSPDDVMQYKAMENLRRAKDLPPSSRERQACMAEALRLFEKGISNMSLQALGDVVAEFRELKWPTGAVELPLRCAVAWDPENLALEWRPSEHHAIQHHSSHGGLQDRSTMMRGAWEIRMSCYGLALDSLELFNYGESATKDIDYDTLKELREEAWHVALSSSDEAFHSRLYDWCMEKNLTDVLLSVRTPFIESHFSSPPLSLEKLELLWQYHVKGGQHLRAAQVLFELAKTSELPISLNKRQEYLQIAVSNARSHAGSELSRQESGVEFLTMAEEHRDVADVQVEIRDEVKSLIVTAGGVTALDAEAEGPWGGLEQLEGSLLTMTQLYQLYADPLRLLPMKLVIFHVSGFHEDGLVRNTWDSIIETVLIQYQSEGLAGQSSALEAEVVKLANRLYPSETAFPLDHIVLKLEAFALEHRQGLQAGWTPRLLVRGNVPQGDIFTSLRTLYDSQVVPFNTRKAIQHLSADIALFLRDWVQDLIRRRSPQSSRDFPADLVDSSIDKYISELSGENAVGTEAIYKEVRSLVRQHF
ncbi:hypothetical protein FRC19_004757 [Serendipita sp. 401]|nr:hypothetical protein FRC19_004757 [Serendipita sp. 401]